MAQRIPYVGVTVAKFQNYMPSFLIKGLKLLGMDFIEINQSILPEIDRFANSLGSLITAFHLPLVSENGWDFSCLDYKVEIDDMIATLRHYKKKLRIQHVISHPPEPEKSANQVDSSFEFLFENLQKLGLPVYLENVTSLDPKAFLNIYWRSKRALGTLLAGMCFDAPHYFVDGHDPIAQYLTFRDLVGCVHLSDCLVGKDAHLPFNSGGALPINEFLATLRNNNFGGYITLELKPQSLNDLEAYIDSYMKTLQFLNYKKHLTTKLRILALRPLINRFAA
ncbi:sugar phosphate isomerase/epimerase [candidate division KSB1 bacterium]|nr:sugar phosphate isomerase/epimerase [candidate division KSB1 bacterium]RQW10020.1 MAG: sugar phosphate isomerase/epimerase [candidate division KSB1 bacterium]